MAWEKRGERWYYYRKRREGDRVVSEYVGGGELGELGATLDALDREERQLERQRVKAWKEWVRAITKAGIDAEEMIQALSSAWLLAQGYHTHKGQWRRKRGKWPRN